MIDDADLKTLTSGRWLVPLMAQIGAEDGSRFAVMLARLGLSRSVLTASLAQLQLAGWVRRNSGHGHPLRPEYVLTPAGEAIAAFCLKVTEQRERLGLNAPDLPRWSLPIVSRLALDRARFSPLRASLAPITPRALSLTLKQMVGTDLVDREIEDDFPPIAIYGLTGRGMRLAEAMR